MDIQVIIIVGDRSISDDGDVEWENVCKYQKLITYTKPIHTLRSGRWKTTEALKIANHVRVKCYKLIEEYLFKLTSSSEGG